MEHHTKWNYLVAEAGLSTEAKNLLAHPDLRAVYTEFVAGVPYPIETEAIMFLGPRAASAVLGLPIKISVDRNKIWSWRPVNGVYIPCRITFDPEVVLKQKALMPFFIKDLKRRPDEL
jgi:hypothetical protein